MPRKPEAPKPEKPTSKPAARRRRGELAPLTDKDREALQNGPEKVMHAGAEGGTAFPVDLRVTGSATAGSSSEAIITEFEATIPVTIKPGAKSPVEDILAVMRAEVIGQDRAISAIARALLRSREGFRTPGRPISTMFFAGPTGVGKTETVRALAKALHGDWREVLKIDCSEYSEPHAIARLIGAPPGYIGSDLPAIFQRENVEGVKNRLILFDEIEKAHFRLHNMLLQIMDEGRVTLARRTKEDEGMVSFEDCIIILTSNVGAADIDRILHANRIGFRNQKAAAKLQTDQQVYVAAREAMKSVFAPEFRNRITEFIVFRALERESLYKILQKLLNISAERFAGMGFKLNLTQEAADWLVDRGVSHELGVRPLVRAVEKYVDTKVAELHAYGLIKAGDLLEAQVVETGDENNDGSPKLELGFFRAPRPGEGEGMPVARKRRVGKTEISMRY
jgi:ATP-dependent Clp protease ATP-binding subunit ClpC